MSTIKEALQEVTHHGQKPEVLMDCGDNQEAYNKNRAVFNLRFDLKPAYIILVENEAQVVNAIEVAKSNRLPIRVCGGKHDHEGESSATGAIVIDFKKMKKWELIDRYGKNPKVSLEPGLRFMDFVEKMAKNLLGKPGRVIPRGTCESVGVAGFTMGGGWGPWTRKYGMCCEYLEEVRLVLPGGGDGMTSSGQEKCKVITANKDENKELFWAIRGGGGFSYGIVTKFIFRTLPAPKHAIKFNVVWRDAPAIKVLERWEQLTNPNFSDPSICKPGNPKLVGTNLKIDGIPASGKKASDEVIDASVHECIFFGYYVGDATDYPLMVKELKDDLKKWFAGELYDKAIINIPDKEANENVKFSLWERGIIKKKTGTPNPLAGVDFEPDHDKPAPHKLTSRLAKSIKDGWGINGRRNLIRSLRSPLISNEGKEMGIHTYVTLGAIWGNYYNNPDHQNQPFPAGNAFPYKDRPYTIQYQCWWNINDRVEGTFGMAYTGDVDLYVNKALDWIAESRQRDFPETLGAFISFKDSSVPTSQYFLQNYEKLQAVKLKYSEDGLNIFHSRKTII